MNAVARILICALAVIGCLYLAGTMTSVLRKHYAVACVENNDDDYGFTTPQIKAGHRPSPALYERYL